MASDDASKESAERDAPSSKEPASASAPPAEAPPEAPEAGAAASEKKDASAESAPSESSPVSSPDAAVSASDPSEADAAENAAPSSAPKLEKAVDEPGLDAPQVHVLPLDDAKTWWAPLALVVVAGILLLFVLPPLTKAGIWDPYELNVADLARRMALKLHGAKNLALEGADNSLPHLNDLGRPQLPFSLIALGFSFFGLQEWAGRAPLALSGLLGAVVTYGFVARLVDRRAGVFSAIALLTMPLYFVQARTMLGDITTMVALAMAFGGLAVAAFGTKDDGSPDYGTRLAWLGLAFVGLAAGFFSRGALLGLFVPAAAIAASWGVVVGAERRVDGLTHVVGAISALVAAFALYKFYGAFTVDPAPLDMSPWVGATMHAPAKYPTFDFMVGHMAHALAPWSGFIPFAMGRLLVAPAANGRPSTAVARESTARMALLLGASASIVAHGVLASRVDLIAFAGPALLAACAGIALRDFERGAHASVAVGVGTMVLLGLFHHDFHSLPDKAYQAYGIAQAVTFPDSFKEKSLQLWNVVLMGFAGVAFLTWVEKDARRKPFDPKTYLDVLRAVRDAWDGFLVLAYFAIVAGTSLSGLAVWFGTRNHSKWLTTIPLQVREVAVGAWWKAAIGPPAIIFGLLFWCDVWLWAFSGPHSEKGRSIRPLRGFEPFEELVTRLRGGNGKASGPAAFVRVAFGSNATEDEAKTATAFALLAPLLFLQIPAVVFVALQKGGAKPIVALALAIPSGVLAFLVIGLIGEILKGSRAAFLTLFAAVAGVILSAVYYPTLANQLSPKEVFETYRMYKKSDDPLALLGVGGRTAAYYAGGQPTILNDPQSACAWLLGGPPGQRRFISVRSDQLARLNQLYRAARRTNVPVLDGRSSQIVLAASELRDGEKSENPLDKILLSAPPHPQRLVDANMEDKLQVLGIDIADERGRLVEVVGPGRKYHLRTYFKVLAPLTVEYEGFIHIDGYRRRHNGDHKMCEGKYPLSMWNRDDYIVDDHEFTLEPNFTQGTYTIYFGLYTGETRLKVKTGPHDGENRVLAGTLTVQ